MRGRQARRLNRACEGTWGAGNRGLLVFCVFVDVWMDIWSCGLGSCVGCFSNTLYCYATPKTTKMYLCQISRKVAFVSNDVCSRSFQSLIRTNSY